MRRTSPLGRSFQSPTEWGSGNSREGPSFGDKWGRGFTSLYDEDGEGAFARGSRDIQSGVGGLAGSYYGSVWARAALGSKDEGDEDLLVAPNLGALKNVEEGSMINIGVDDARLSSRYLSQSSEADDQSSYLMEMAERRIDEFNAKEMAKAGMIGNLIGAGTMIAANAGFGAIDSYHEKRAVKKHNKGIRDSLGIPELTKAQQKETGVNATNYGRAHSSFDTENWQEPDPNARSRYRAKGKAQGGIISKDFSSSKSVGDAIQKFF